ncbi:hypothetical protein BpHYR1_023426 [Brachionus plicatilis]|uniref:Uncharacterized protein n=1 Tax=Brachionus plicatilis TaxID=10195 RepID=A0A3M7P2Z0_BRAPC|nr:hypothetical protein BpHYR1_023426 [Brachionus plicatilis]
MACLIGDGFRLALSESSSSLFQELIEIDFLFRSADSSTSACQYLPNFGQIDHNCRPQIVFLNCCCRRGKTELCFPWCQKFAYNYPRKNPEYATARLACGGGLLGGHLCLNST